MSRIISIGGLAMDWTPETQDGHYIGWIEAPFSQPSIDMVMVERDGTWPVTTGVRHGVRVLPPLYVRIFGEAAEIHALRVALYRALDTSVEPKRLVIANDDGSNPRYFMCHFMGREEGSEAEGSGQLFVVTAGLVDDPYARSVDGEEVLETLTSPVHAFNVVNGGELDAYPVIEIEPRLARGGQHWEWREFLPVSWRLPRSATQYPTRVFSAVTTGLVTDGKAIDGTSVGLFVDGVEVDRWFAGEDGSHGGFDDTSNIWANLDFQPGLLATLAVAIDDGGMFGTWLAHEIVVNESIDAFPASGLLYIPVIDEVFRYRSKDNTRRKFTQVTRADFGAVEGAIPVGSEVQWLQHEIYLVYGPYSGLARVPDDSKKPLMSFAQTTNIGWRWDIFGSDEEPERTGAWLPVTHAQDEPFTGDGSIPRTYTGVHDGTATDPWAVMGIAYARGLHQARWQLYTPTSFTSAAINFDYYLPDAGPIFAFVAYGSVDGASWVKLGEFLDASTSAGWTTNETLNLTNSNPEIRYLALTLTSESNGAKVEAISVTISYGFSDTTPYDLQLTDGEKSNYSLEMAITNATTGESIRLDMPVGLSLYNRLVIDSDEHTVATKRIEFNDEVFWLNRYHIMSKGSVRPRMLRLVPGENLLRFSEAGLNEVNATVRWEERWYS